MQRSTVGVVVALALLSTGVAVRGQSSDAFLAQFLGNWKLNVAKSTYTPGPAPKSNSAKWESWEGGFKVTIDGIDAQGRATHIEQIGKFDGKDYPRKGAPAANTTRGYKRIDDRTYEAIEKVDGKVTTTTRSVTSRDGKTRTVTAAGKNAQGQTVSDVAVWEKQ